MPSGDTSFYVRLCLPLVSRLFRILSSRSCILRISWGFCSLWGLAHFVGITWSTTILSIPRKPGYTQMYANTATLSLLAFIFTLSLLLDLRGHSSPLPTLMLCPSVAVAFSRIVSPSSFRPCRTRAPSAAYLSLSVVGTPPLMMVYPAIPVAGAASASPTLFHALCTR